MWSSHDLASRLGWIFQEELSLVPEMDSLSHDSDKAVRSLSRLANEHVVSWDSHIPIGLENRSRI